MVLQHLDSPYSTGISKRGVGGATFGIEIFDIELGGGYVGVCGSHGCRADGFLRDCGITGLPSSQNFRWPCPVLRIADFVFWWRYRRVFLTDWVSGALGKLP